MSSVGFEIALYFQCSKCNGLNRTLRSKIYLVMCEQVTGRKWRFGA
jgi:hypothetical protein